MKFVRITILLLISFCSSAQLVNNNILCAKSSTADYRTLYAFFDNLAIIQPGSVYSNTAGTTSSNRLSPVKYISDVVGGGGVVWTSDDNIRKSYLAPAWGASFNLLRPIYNYPAGDIPHITIPNIVDVLLTKNITSNSSPNTRVTVIRKRDAVLDENQSFGETISYKENSDNHASIGNNIGQVKITDSNLLPANQWTILILEDNAANSKIYFNASQNGSAVTLSAGSLSQFGIGTVSHVMECDVAMFGVIKGILSGGSRASLVSAIQALFPIGSTPNKPFASNINVSFSTNTFTCNYTYNNGGTGLSENTSLRQVEWFCLTPGSSPDGWTGLDAQKVVWHHTSNTLNRSSFPTYFPSPGTNTTQIGCRVKVYGTGGITWNGVTPRSNSLNDNIAGTPGTPVPHLITATIEDANTKRFILTFGDGTGTLDNTSGSVNDFKVFVNEIEVVKSSISFPGGNVLHLDVVNDVISTDAIRIQLIHGGNALQDNGNVDVEEFVTGPIIAIGNNIDGPITAKANFTWFVDTSSPGWLNYTYDSAVPGVIDANMDDVNGSSTGIQIEVSDAFQGFSDNNTPQTNTDFPDGNITKRGYGLWSGGQNQGALKLSGFTAGQSVDIKVALQYSNGGNATTSVSVIGGTTQNYTGLNVATLQQVNSSTTANGSGEITIQVNTTSSGETMINGLIFTKYP